MQNYADRNCIFCDGTDRISQQTCPTVDRIRYACSHCTGPFANENIHAFVRVQLRGHEPLIFRVMSGTTYPFENFAAVTYNIGLPFTDIDNTHMSNIEFCATARTLQMIGLKKYDARILRDVHIEQIDKPPVVFPVDAGRGCVMRSSLNSLSPCILIDIILNF